MNNKKKINGLLQHGLMYENTATAFVRAGGRCEYCGCDLLYDRLKYAIGEMDHLLPKKEHPQLEHCVDNMIYSCRLCNLLKGVFDPAKVALTCDQLRDRRDEFVQSARKYIHERRLEYDCDPAWLKVMKIMDGGLIDTDC